MEKYYSSVLSSMGLMCTYKILCEKNPASQFYIIRDGTISQRNVFFNELYTLLKNFNIIVFSPFFDECINGIYLKTYDTYILSDTFYSKVSPLSHIFAPHQTYISEKINLSLESKKELSHLYFSEKNYYKKAVSEIRLAAVYNENRNLLLSSCLSEDKLINIIRRVMKKIPLNVKHGSPEVRFLSALTPLGIHTNWNTLFENYRTVIEIRDFSSFASSVVLGIIKDILVKSNEYFIFVPELYRKSIPQTILLPQSSTAIVRTDDNYPLPFTPTHRLDTAKALMPDSRVTARHDALKKAENRCLDAAVLNIYEGHEKRRIAENILAPFSDEEKPISAAKELFSKITSLNARPLI